MKNVIDLLQERGFIDQITGPELRELVMKPIRLYLGFDPTAESLHLGNLLGIVALAWFQKCGHVPFALIGGATGRIGDPSGKSFERPLLSEEDLARNVKCLTTFFHKILAFPEGPKPVILNNNEWLGSFTLIDFLRDVGKYFRISPMLSKESVRIRLESEDGMSYTEFSYQLLQGYDFYYLNQKFDVTLQLGGSDQWGNITAGIEYNRKLRGPQLFGLTWPLLTRSDGKKFGKTEEGAVWLSSEKLSPYHFYQYLFRIPDADVIKLLKLLTFLPLEEIYAIESSMQEKGYEPNTAQKVLAEEVTRFVHGEEGLLQARRVTAGIAPGTDAKLTGKSLQALASEMPHASLAKDEVLGQKFVDLALKVGLIPSKSEGVRLIKNGGAYLNNERIDDPLFAITEMHFIDGIYLLLSSGKKKKILVQVEIDLKNNR